MKETQEAESSGCLRGGKLVTEGSGRRLLNYIVFGTELICLTEIETRTSDCPKKKVKLKTLLIFPCGFF